MRQIKITPVITNRTPSVERYFSEIEKLKMITSEEEIELARRIKQGDREAEKKLIHANLRFVVSVAKKYQSKSTSLEDLINDGNIGLIKAAKKFDETKGFKFISYAVWWIRQSILESLGLHIRSVRVPLNIQTLSDKVRRFSDDFEQKNERQPSTEEVCEEFDITPDMYNKMINHMGGEYSLDRKVTEDSEDTFVDSMSSGTIDAYDQIEKDSINIAISSAMDTCLTTIEKEIICLYYGFGCSEREGLTMDEIGLKFNLTGERIRQIKEKSIRKLRTNARCKKIFERLS